MVFAPITIMAAEGLWTCCVMGGWGEYWTAVGADVRAGEGMGEEWGGWELESGCCCPCVCMKEEMGLVCAEPDMVLKEG